MSRSPVERLLDPDAPVLVVAEIGSNHDGDLERGLALVDAAADAGADAVQFHSFRAARLAALRTMAAAGARGAADAVAQIERAELRTEWHARLRDRATARGMVFLAIPFDEERAALLAALGVAAVAVAAADLTNPPLLRVVGGFGRPVLLGVADADQGRIETALAAIGEGAGAPPRRPPVLLVAGPGSEPRADARVRVDVLGVRFGAPTGWSDARRTHALALGAVALGARLVVKPFTDDRSRRGPSHASALEPSELRALVAAVRELETALRETSGGAGAPGVGSRVALR